MRLYRFNLPTHNNVGLTYELARKRWAAEAVKLCGGLTTLPISQGEWVGEERTYKETVVPYEVACEPETADKLVAFAFGQFSDQEAIFVADLGEARIVQRPLEAAQAA